MEIIQKQPCQRCKGMNGWYEKRVVAYEQFYDAEGEATNASDMWAHRGGVRKYCAECNADITGKVGEP